MSCLDYVKAPDHWYGNNLVLKCSIGLQTRSLVTHLSETETLLLYVEIIALETLRRLMWKVIQSYSSFIKTAQFLFLRQEVRCQPSYVYDLIYLQVNTKCRDTLKQQLWTQDFHYVVLDQLLLNLSGQEVFRFLQGTFSNLFFAVLF